ncbi:MAG: hypothetical protein J4O09_09765 [Chloroflexi bacterium]|nr:hypothetical protein [Chloroflexota bacterium]
MRKKIGNILANIGAPIGVWAAVLLVWNFSLVLFPSADYEVAGVGFGDGLKQASPDDASITMTGKKGQTITLLLKPGKSAGAFWATSGITLSLTSPNLGPIDVEVVPPREPDWPDEIRFTFGGDTDFDIKGEFTIP